jgi:hypothetical protein
MLRNIIVMISLVAVLVVLTAPSATAHPLVPPHLFSKHGPTPNVLQTPQKDWTHAGYLTMSASNPDQLDTVTYVEGTFNVPPRAFADIDCSNSPSSIVLAWVGLDNGPTIEQAGIQADCVGGVPEYKVWYDMYPSPLQYIQGAVIHPGDSMRFLVQKDPDNTHVNVCGTNLTTGQNLCKNDIIKPAGATFSTAEWVVEAQTNVPLMPWWGAIAFSNCSAQVKDAGIYYNVTADSIHQATWRYDMGDATTTRASTGPLFNSNANFTVQQLGYWRTGPGLLITIRK